MTKQSVRCPKHDICNVNDSCAHADVHKGNKNCCVLVRRKCPACVEVFVYNK